MLSEVVGMRVLHVFIHYLMGLVEIYNNHNTVVFWTTWAIIQNNMINEFHIGVEHY